MGAGTLGLLNLIGGVAILLWGLRMVRTGATRALGSGLHTAIRNSTKSRFLAMLTGAGMTAMVQSSTAVILLVSSFASRGLIKTGPALATVLGADVGTTVVAQILSFDLSFLIPLCAFIGIVIHMAANKKSTRNIGRIFLGLAFMLIALGHIVGASNPMRESVLIQQLIVALQDELILALLLAAMMTWLSHSSLAMILLVMSLASSGDIPASLALVLVLGINIGGTLPALSATLGGEVEGKRVAVGNLIFRTLGVLFILPFLDYLSPYVAEFEAAPERQIANFHLMFNVALACCCIFLTDVMARFVEKLLPAPTENQFDQNSPLKPIYLNAEIKGDVGQGLNNAAREALRMGDVVYKMLTQCMNAFNGSSAEVIMEIERLEKDVDRLNEAIKFYVTDVSRLPMSLADSQRCMTIVNYVTNLEHIGDLIDRNLMELAHSKQKSHLNFSEAGTNEISILHDRLVGNLELSLNLFISQDEDIAEQLLSEKRAFKNAQIQATHRHIERLRDGTVESKATSAIHMDLLRDFKQINSHITALSYSFLETDPSGSGAS